MEQAIDIQTLNLGQKVLAVHRDYAYKNKVGGKVVQAKVLSFRNISGDIHAELQIAGGSKAVATTEVYLLFKTSQDAIEAIR